MKLKTTAAERQEIDRAMLAEDIDSVSPTKLPLLH